MSIAPDRRRPMRCCRIGRSTVKAIEAEPWWVLESPRRPPAPAPIHQRGGSSGTGGDDGSVSTTALAIGFAAGGGVGGGGGGGGGLGASIATSYPTSCQ